jgi:uncharacterized cysteine cluster protein YcgN (CxxCxxCC family)
MMDREEWEALCKRCGKCCYEKIDLGGGVIRYTSEPCKYLDTETKLCKVYANRAEVEPDCIILTPEKVREISWMPEDCAYVEYMRLQDTLAAVRKSEARQKRREHARRKR